MQMLETLAKRMTAVKITGISPNVDTWLPFISKKWCRIDFLIVIVNDRSYRKVLVVEEFGSYGLQDVGLCETR